MGKIHKSAAEALADKTYGSRVIQGTCAEAFKLAGNEAKDVNGNAAWYCTPISQAPGQKLDDPGCIWNISVSRSEDANKASIAATLEAHPDLASKNYEIVLTQDAYLGDHGDYHASGYLASENEDEETGPTVKVTWAALEGAEEMDDESSRCDWSKPESIVHYRLGDITEMSTVK